MKFIVTSIALNEIIKVFFLNCIFRKIEMHRLYAQNQLKDSLVIPNFSVFLQHIPQCLSLKSGSIWKNFRNKI